MNIIEPNLNQEYWDNRYNKNEIGWDIGAPSTPLKEYFDTISDKTISILIPGAGNACEAEYLIGKGFKNVSVIDISRKAWENIKTRIPELLEEQIICADFFNWIGQYDLIIEQTFFCALNPNLRLNYVEKMAELLKPDGLLIGLLFQKELNTEHPPFGGNSNEYQSLFETQFRIHKMETAYNSIPPRANSELFIKLSVK